MTNKSYKTDSRRYLSQKKWEELWYYSLGEHKREGAKVTLSYYKEPAKDILMLSSIFDYNNLNEIILKELSQKKIDKLIENFDFLTTSRRMINYGGVLKEIKSELKEQSELISEE